MNYAQQALAKYQAQKLVEKIHNIQPEFPARLTDVKKLYRALGKTISQIDPRGVRQ